MSDSHKFKLFVAFSASIIAGVAWGQSLGVANATERDQAVIISHDPTISPGSEWDALGNDIRQGDLMLQAWLLGDGVIDIIDNKIIDNKTESETNGKLSGLPDEAEVKSQAGPSEEQWYRLRLCESSDNESAVSPQGWYRGLYQFDLQTWRSVGGQGDPALATRQEQDLRALLLYVSRGPSPWPVCGRYLK